MKAISLHAPWGTLLHTRKPGPVPEGQYEWLAKVRGETYVPAPMVKRFETRSWPCPPSIIGQRIAIHQAKRQPQWAQIGDYYVERYYENVQHTDECDCDYEGGVAPSCTRGATSRMVLTTPGPTLVADLPLGCIVASGVITRSLPIVAPFGECPDGAHVAPMKDGSLALCAGPSKGLVKQTDISDQIPYGEWSIGRFAWELSDVAATTERCPLCRNQFDGKMPGGYYGSNWDWVPCQTCMGEGKCEPIPAKGAQRFWEWRP